VLPEQNYAGSEIASTVFAPKEPVNPSMVAFQKDLGKIKAGKDQGALTGPNAAIYTEAIIKKYGAMNPHLLTEYRKQAADVWQTSVYGQAGKATYDLLKQADANKAAREAYDKDSSVLWDFYTTGAGAQMGVEQKLTRDDINDPIKRETLTLGMRVHFAKVAQVAETKRELEATGDTQAYAAKMSGGVMQLALTSTYAPVAAKVTNLYLGGKSYEELQTKNGEIQDIAHDLSAERNKVSALIDQYRQMKHPSGAPMFDSEWLDKMRDKQIAVIDAELERLSNADSFNAYRRNMELTGKQVGYTTAVTQLNMPLNQLYQLSQDLEKRTNKLNADLLSNPATKHLSIGKRDFTTKEEELIRPLLNANNIPLSMFRELNHAMATQDFGALKRGVERTIKETGGNKTAIYTKAAADDPYAQFVWAEDNGFLSSMTPSHLTGNKENQLKYANILSGWIDVMAMSKQAGGVQGSLNRINAMSDNIEVLEPRLKEPIKKQLLHQLISVTQRVGGPISTIEAVNTRLEDQGLGKNSIELVWNKAKQRIEAIPTTYKVPSSTSVLPGITDAAKKVAKQTALNEVQSAVDDLNNNILWMNSYSDVMEKKMSVEEISKGWINYSNTKTLPEYVKTYTGARTGVPIISPTTPAKSNMQISPKEQKLRDDKVLQLLYQERADQQAAGKVDPQLENDIKYREKRLGK